MSIIDKNPVDKQLFELSDSIKRTQRLDESLRKSKANSERTLASRTPETLEKQRKFKEQKAIDQARIKELSEELAKLKSFLFDALSKSAEEKGVNAALKDFAEELKIFKSMSDEEARIMRKKHGNYIGYYNSLFIDLSTVNEGFMLVAPNEILMNLETKYINKLNENQLNLLLKKYKEANLVDSEYFRKKYMKCFPALINQIKDIDDFISAMLRHPEYYSHMNKELRKNISLYAPELKTIIVRNPKVIEYMPSDDIDLVASRYANYIGSVIENNIKVLDYLYPSFFRTHNPKYIFNNVNKSKLYPKIEEYLPKFAELREFFAKSKAKINPKKEEQNAEITETSGMNV